VTLSLGAFEIPVSLLLILTGVVAAGAVARAGARRHGLSPRLAVDGLFLMIVVGLLVGHLTDVVLYRWDAFRADWRELGVASGGVCSLGAVAGAALAGAVWFRRAPGGMLAHADNLVVGLSLGWAIGRLGCFIDHDHLGRLSTSPLAVAMPGGRRHDLGLYEGVLALFIFLLLWRRDRSPAAVDRHRRPGQALALAALLFGAGRFAIECLRADDLELLGRRSDARLLGLTLVQYAAVVLVGCGATLVRGLAAMSTAATSIGAANHAVSIERKSPRGYQWR
jgi:phosphatidylglycerol:prolipoprotein diacylglycerol transferase